MSIEPRPAETWPLLLRPTSAASLEAYVESHTPARVTLGVGPGCDTRVRGGDAPGAGGSPAG